MTDPAVDRYREAIRRGHLAASRGDNDEALAAFGEAAELAPDRPLPQVGRGVALHRAGRAAEALEAFDRAIQVAPLDEAALRGRGAVQVALGRAGDAAATLTGLAESLEADGRLEDALELGREALALASTPARFRLVARLSASVRRSSAESPGLEGAGGEPADGGPPGSPGDAPLRESHVEALAAGDALFDTGQLDAARVKYLAAARRFREDRQLVAALDACFLVMTIAPADPEVHLVLAEVYRERGWTEVAVEKLVLLARLLDLQGDRATLDRLCELAAREFPGEPRLAEVCPGPG